ncbi:hypothetical protein AX16_010866 [Volvariella volvacea WC 439]|nr:hypothetical protein AX16_010866 [Volvariella volvacea WC 439]
MHSTRLRQASAALPWTFILTIATAGLVVAQSSEPTTPDADVKCKMSDKAQATVTLYTTALFTVVSTITNPFNESFMLAWIAWFPPVRAAAGVVIHSFDILRHLQAYLRRPSTKRQASHNPEAGSSQHRRNAPPRDYFADETHFASHAIWWIWHVYIPISQWAWFAEHHKTANAGVLFARATALGVVLVSMSIDYKARVIRSMAKKTGAFVGILMALLSLATRWSLLVLKAFEYILAVLHNPNVAMKNNTYVPIYCVFSVIWGVFSFPFVYGRDEGDKVHDEWNILTIFRPFLGLFFACFTCTIAFIIFGTADASNGLTLSQFVKCNSVSTWSKIQGVLF